MDIKGYIVGIRASPKPLEEHLVEISQNCLESIRLAEKNYPDENITSTIDINIYLDNNNIPIQIEIEDNSTGRTGIKNLESKGPLKMYNHQGEKTGFSEYGEGGSEATKQIANSICFETVTDSGLSESLSLNIEDACVKNSFKQAARYSREGIYFPKYGNTGAKLTLNNLTESYKTKENADKCLNGELATRMSSGFVKLSSNISHFKLNILHGELITEYDIKPQTNLKEQLRSYVINLFKNKNTGELVSIVELENKKNSKEKITYVKGQKKNMLKKIVFTDKEVETNYDRISMTPLILYLSTDEERDIDRMGFDGHRKVEGNNIIKTNSDPLTMSWDLFKSHRTSTGFVNNNFY
jgi:hypothetical protein